MRLPLTLSTLLLSVVVSSFPALAQRQDAPRGAPRQVDLNEFVVNGNGLKTARKKVRVDHISMHFDVVEVGDPKPYDSTYILTQFPAPTDKKFMLASVEGRIADFDSTQFEMYLTVLQFNGADTLFQTVPVSIVPHKKRPKNRHVMQIRDSGIVLQPVPFYLGYGFHTRPVKEAYMYRLYAAHYSAGKGIRLHIQDGKWHLYNPPYMTELPFKISYLEL